MRRPEAWWRRIPYGSVLGIAAAIYISLYLVQAVKHNYELQQQVSILKEQIANLQVDKQQLQYKIQYYGTDVYKEKEARARLGLQAPGESVIILPHPDPTATQKTAAPPKPKPKSNPGQWLDFLTGNS